MDTIRKIGARVSEQPGETTSPQVRFEREEAGIRTLQDWELLLAGGGDGVPGWPG